ncbi:hypothetical protein OEZ85_003870 [Tetradesmus obliquus]|uniref:G8 domain-containing protein n=1 Tax=Tetradesmus obliquus TaxID=3088 RepID=A0ABY8UGG6_TETOB|nr:hypothetical protein OEZ85_003870 [Tetradesmus obliquus]
MPFLIRQQLPLLAAVLLLLAVAANAAAPSRLSVDFSSSLIVSPGSTPSSVQARLDALLADMHSDGVNNLCNGRLDEHVCNGNPKKLSLRTPVFNFEFSKGQDDAKCILCAPAAPADAAPCTCTAPGNKTRCSCSGKLTGAQFFDSSLYGIELARVLVEAVGEDNTIKGGSNANFNSTVRFIGSKLTITRAEGVAGEEAGHDLELDESHLDLLEGSELHILDDGDLEVEDAGSLWLSGQSKVVAAQSSNIQTQLAHVLVEGGSSISIQSNSSWMVTQEFDFTPAQASATCNKPFEPNAPAEACFKDKEACWKRHAKGLLTGPEKEALGMLQYPPKTDRWGRQAFDYADDDVYDDFYDQDYIEPQFEAGECLGSDVCGQPAAAAASSSSSSSAGKRRSLLAPAPAPAPLPAVAAPSAAAASGSSTNSTDKAGDDKDGDSDKAGNDKDGDTDKATHSSNTDKANNSTDTDSDSSSTPAATAVAPAARVGDEDNNTPGVISTEVNAKDTLDGAGYDPEWGEGPYGETLCDAPPFRAFNYYGLVVRGGSSITISASTWELYDQSRVFITDSSLSLEAGATLRLLNSTITLINSTLEVKGGSEIILERFSGLHLFNSHVTGDSALFAVPAEQPRSGSTWKGKPWLQRGDYRASAGGGLPVSMGVQPGVQLGLYPVRVLGFDMEARMLPAAGCNCKKPLVTMNADAAWTGMSGGADLLEGLI